VPIQSPEYAQVLNRQPRGFITWKGHEARVQVIDDGLWAQSLQRHLCHILFQTDRSLAAMHRYPGEAAAFQATTATIYGRLRFYPLVAAMERRPEDSHLATPGLDDLLRTHPQWVPAAVWAQEGKFRPLHGAESAESWFSPALPAGTVYDFAAREESLPDLRHLGNGELERLAQLAPWNFRIAERLVLTRGAARPSSRQFEAVLGKFLSFYRAALQEYPVIVRDNPGDYAANLGRMAELDPTLYTTLGAYHARHHQDDEAAQAYLKVIDARVTASAKVEACSWLADFYLGRGHTTEALAVGKLATDTGLASGWETMAIVLERLGRQAEAETLYQKIEEMYDDPSPLALFYSRQAWIPAYAAKQQAALTRLFPGGITAAQNSTHPPDRGVAVRRESGLAEAAGLCERDVVVAVNGQAAGSLEQYAYLRRAAGERNSVSLLVFHDGGYRELQVGENVELPLSELATYHR
jgi:tetratricopeptide (TPR) repeat protein